RRFEYQGIHSGCVVESHPDRGVGSDGHHRYLLQSVDRLWRTSEGNHPVPGFATGSVYLVLSHIRHRQPAWRRDSRASAKSGKPRPVAERTIAFKVDLLMQNPRWDSRIAHFPRGPWFGEVETQ